MSRFVRSLSSGRNHLTGRDAPTSGNMERREEYDVQPLTMELIDGLTRVHNEGFGSKVCCLCCPVADTDGKIRKFYEKHPERLSMCGVAICKDSSAVLGFVMLAIHPMHDKDGLHTTKVGETYVEQISVATAARGKGIGKLLLQYAENRALERKCTTMTLAVLNGNPARRLYERFGFVACQSDMCEQCIGACLVCCIAGRPYGVCDPHWGAVDMKKDLAACQ